MSIVQPSCPKCGSFHVFLNLRPHVRLQNDHQYKTFVNASSKRCSNCGHEWDRMAHRSRPADESPVPEPGFWTRLFLRLFPFLK